MTLAERVRLARPWVAILLASCVGVAAAEEPPPVTWPAAPATQGVVSLASSATMELPKDWMSVTFSTTRDGADAASVQAAVRQALETALATARQAARPGGGLEVETGGFSLQPRWSSKGQPAGWTGRGELLVQGRDMAAIAQLAGRIGTLTIDHLEYSVSREAREKVEGELAAQAIGRFRAKAADYAKAFGYAGFTVREVSVGTDAEQAPPPRPFARMAAAAAAADAALPVEAGKGTVTATVSGTVQMK